MFDRDSPPCRLAFYNFRFDKKFITFDRWLPSQHFPFGCSVASLVHFAHCPLLLCSCSRPASRRPRCQTRGHRPSGSRIPTARSRCGPIACPRGTGPRGSCAQMDARPGGRARRMDPSPGTRSGEQTVRSMDSPRISLWRPRTGPSGRAKNEGPFFGCPRDFLCNGTGEQRRTHRASGSKTF